VVSGKGQSDRPIDEIVGEELVADPEGSFASFLDIRVVAAEVSPPVVHYPSRPTLVVGGPAHATKAGPVIAEQPRQVLHVLLVVHQLQVRGIDARPRVAHVIHEHALRDISVGQLVGGTVRKDVLAFEAEDPVLSADLPTRPDPAALALFRIRFELVAYVADDPSPKRLDAATEADLLVVRVTQAPTLRRLDALRA